MKNKQQNNVSITNRNEQVLALEKPAESFYNHYERPSSKTKEIIYRKDYDPNYSPTVTLSPKIQQISLSKKKHEPIESKTI